MRILIVHNFYGSEAPSGENRVVELERALLTANGHTTKLHTAESDRIRKLGVAGMITGGALVPWNPAAKARLSKEVSRFRPDIVHVHNTFPLLSPSIFYATDRRVPVVLTLHNYRLVCAAGTPLRNRKICTLCLDRTSAWSALRYGCYRNSRLATAPLAASIELHRRIGTWKRHVDAFITLSDFQRNKMASAGLPASKIHVKPNFYTGASAGRPWSDRRQCVLFVGRLSVEKGVHTLLEAWHLWGEEAPDLRIAGSGPLEDYFRRQVTQRGMGNVHLLGQLQRDAITEELSNARMVILPSECYEGFALVIPEAFACGTPVAVSAIGPLPSIVRDGVEGVHFRPKDPQDMVRVVRSTWGDQMSMSQMGGNARKAYESKYSGGANYRFMMDIYRKAIQTFRVETGEA